MKLTEGTRVWVSGDSVELWIKDYNVRVNSGATVELTPNPNAKKVLVTIDYIDNDSLVTTLVRRSRLSVS
jgi:hypothetical protein